MTYIAKKNIGPFTIGDIILESDLTPETLKELLQKEVLEEYEGELLFDKSSNVKFS